MGPCKACFPFVAKPSKENEKLCSSAIAETEEIAIMSLLVCYGIFQNLFKRSESDVV